MAVSEVRCARCAGGTRLWLTPGDALSRKLGYILLMRMSRGAMMLCNSPADAKIRVPTANRHVTTVCAIYDIVAAWFRELVGTSIYRVRRKYARQSALYAMR